MIPPRFGVSRQEIAEIVRAFYARVRQDDVLGPIFSNHVDDWSAHEEKITRFWASAILHERSYVGNPMQIHKDAGDVDPEHFQVWLALFDETLRDHPSDQDMQQWSQLAHRIGRGLTMGLADQRRPGHAAPILS